jgi:hypothetical protein
MGNMSQLTLSWFKYQAIESQNSNMPFGIGLLKDFCHQAAYLSQGRDESLGAKPSIFE